MARERKRWQVLAKIINTRKFHRVVLVGAGDGKLASELLARCAGIELFIVDPDGRTKLGKYPSRLAPFTRRVTIITGPDDLTRKVDLAFLDAAHLDDISLWETRVLKNGIISGVGDVTDTYHDSDIHYHDDDVWTVRMDA